MEVENIVAFFTCSEIESRDIMQPQPRFDYHGNSVTFEHLSARSSLRGTEPLTDF